MNLLLDTQAIIWYVEDESLLTNKTRVAIRSAEIVYVSAISFYEIAIKLEIGKDVGITRPLPNIIKKVLESGFIWLPLSPRHIEAYLLVPLIGNHKDPVSS